MVADIISDGTNLRTTFLGIIVAHACTLPIFWRFVRSNPARTARLVDCLTSWFILHDVVSLLEVRVFPLSF